MTWLWKQIGIKDDFFVHLDEATLAFHQVRVLWIGLALLIPAGYFIYRRQQQNLRTVPSLPRLVLTVTRVLILALLILVLAGPYLKLDLQNEKKPIVAVLFDHSQSMQLEAGPFDSDSEVMRIADAAGYRTTDGRLEADTRKALNKVSRAKLVHSVTQNTLKTFLEPLAKKYELQCYSVAEDVKPIAVEPGKIDFPEPPHPRDKWGTATHLGDAVHHVLSEAAGRPVAGIIAFTDGQNTGGRSFAEVARAAAGAGTPVFGVPVGTSTRLKDVAIVDVFTTGLVPVGDTARVAVTVESQGFDKRPVKVELREGDKVLDSKELVLRSTEQQQVELTFQAKEPGAHHLTVQIPEQAEEPENLRGNNKDSAYVRVTEDKVRVLYLEGLPRWDFRFLKNAMRRDDGLGGRKEKTPDIVLEAEWQRLPAARQATALPATLDALAEYHTVILGDVSPNLLTSDFVDLLVKAVREKGLGLVVEVGPQHMPHAFDERMRELLPVRLDRNASGMPSPDYKPFVLELTPDGSIHEAMRFYDDPGRNQNAWAYMPPFYWSAAVERPSPAATVLAWNGSVAEGRYGKLPLIAHHYAGQGRVMFVGTDSTWLWRQNVGDRYFYKFWGQAIRFVARRDQTAMKKSWMEVRPLRAQPGEKASIELMAFNADGSPRTDRTLTAQVADGKGGRSLVSLTADTSTKGRYTGNFLLQNAGEYRVTHNAGAGAAILEAKVRVTDSIEEMRHPNVDRVALQRLSDTSGGQMVELPDLGVIPDRLKGETKRSRLHRETDVWDNWLVLGVLVFLYSLDVGMRRLAGLS